MRRRKRSIWTDGCINKLSLNFNFIAFTELSTWLQMFLLKPQGEIKARMNQLTSSDSTNWDLKCCFWARSLLKPSWRHVRFLGVVLRLVCTPLISLLSQRSIWDKEMSLVICRSSYGFPECIRPGTDTTSGTQTRLMKPLWKSFPHTLKTL